MRERKILLFEDNDAVRHLVDKHLGLTGHAIVDKHRGTNLSQALEMLDELKSGALEADTILLDGNLSPYDTSGSDARTIVDRIDKLQLPHIVIGFSQLSMSRDYDPPIRVDVDARKRSLDNKAGQLITILNNL